MATDPQVTLFIGNVPSGTRRDELTGIFQSIGPVKRCSVVFNSQKKPTTIAYVEYVNPDHALQAAKEMGSSTYVGSNRLIIKVTKSRQFQPDYAPKLKRKEPKKEVPNYRDKISKKGRLVIRNISFKVTEDDLQQHFGKYGTINDVKLLRKPDGTSRGCGFVQFVNVPCASAAIKACNAQKLLGRTIAVDWAIPKHEFQSSNPQIKKEPCDEPATIKSEETEDNEEMAEEENSDSEDSEDDEGTNEDSALGSSEEDGDDDEPKAKKKRYESNDAQEGKTVFVRNMAFATADEDLRSEFEKFGEVTYAVLCMDKLTEHPKGTAFVKFKEKESCDQCLTTAATNEGIYLDGRKLEVMLAMRRSDITDKNAKKKEKPGKDNRHLYLLREGLIRPGSSAAEGVSPGDMAKRLNLERHKRQIIKNLSTFVSTNRLCVHNLPLVYTDGKLKKLFKKHGGHDCKVTEAKIMRNLNKTDSAGQGESKGYGFVSFTEHEHALNALRALNNNPDIFTKTSRPIVEFSVENVTAVKAKEKRLQKSLTAVPKSEPATAPSKKPQYAGDTADPKVKSIPSQRKLNELFDKQREKNSEQKKNKKISRNLLRRQRDLKTKRKNKKVAAQAVQEKTVNVPESAEPSKSSQRKAKRSLKKLKEEDDFNKLVAKYRNKLMQAENA